MIYCTHCGAMWDSPDDLLAAHNTTIRELGFGVDPLTEITPPMMFCPYCLEDF